MLNDALEKRRLGLEAEYFARENERKIMELKRSRGPTDSSGRLLELGVSDDMLGVLGFLPLFEVAWSDGRLDDAERDVLLEIAHGSGVEANSAGGRLLASWIRAQPDPEFHEAWMVYVQGSVETYDGSGSGKDRGEVLAGAHKVARSSGGMLGLGSVSPAERRVLDDIERALAA